MIHLPPLRRHNLIGFTTCIVACLFSIIYILKLFFHLDADWSTQLVVIIGLLLVTFSSIKKIYRLWDKLTKIFASASAKFIIFICYLFVILPLGFVWNLFELTNKNNSRFTLGWVQRDRDKNFLYLSQHDSAAIGLGDSWIIQYLKWAIKSRNFSFINLLPYLVILKILGKQQSNVYNGNTYTLY